MRFLLAAVALLLLPLPAPAATPPVTASKSWMRYLLPTIPAAGYMVLQNNGATDMVLISAASPACKTLMLHKSQDHSGMAMMMDVGAITIPARGAISFTPGGYHLMCAAPRMKVGDKVNIVLTFQDSTKLNITAPVYGAQTAP